MAKGRRGSAYLDESDGLWDRGCASSGSTFQCYMYEAPDLHKRGENSLSIFAQCSDCTTAGQHQDKQNKVDATVLTSDHRHLKFGSGFGFLVHAIEARITWICVNSFESKFHLDFYISEVLEIE